MSFQGDLKGADGQVQATLTEPNGKIAYDTQIVLKSYENAINFYRNNIMGLIGSVNGQSCAPQQMISSYSYGNAPVETLERLATEFNQPPYALNVFPISMKCDVKVDCALEVDNANVVLSCFKKADRQDGYVLRLFNNDSRKTQTTLRFKEGAAMFTFGAYEVKTLIYNNGVMQEIEEMII